MNNLCVIGSLIEAMMFTGTTAWQAYKDALFESKTVEQLFRDLAQRKCFVTYWDFGSGSSAWEFELNHIE
jgi:hypothetical protein